MSKLDEAKERVLEEAEKPKPLPPIHLQIDDYLDLVLHCHYTCVSGEGRGGGRAAVCATCAIHTTNSNHTQNATLIMSGAPCPRHLPAT